MALESARGRLPGSTGALLLAALVSCAEPGHPDRPQGPVGGAPPSADDPAAPTRLVIDVREPRAFAAAHVPGALNLQLTWQQLPDRAPAYVPDRSTPLRIQVADETQWGSASSILIELGYEDLEPSFSTAGMETATLDLLTAAELRELLDGPSPPVVLDVRTAEEWRTGVIEGAILVEAANAPEVLGQLDPSRQYAVICEGGVRSSQLASLLKARGFEEVSNVIDGMWAWRRLSKN